MNTVAADTYDAEREGHHGGLSNRKRSFCSFQGNGLDSVKPTELSRTAACFLPRRWSGKTIARKPAKLRYRTEWQIYRSQTNLKRPRIIRTRGDTAHGHRHPPAPAGLRAVMPAIPAISCHTVTRVLVHNTTMSDDEMNIDDGPFLCLLWLCPF